MEKVDKGDLFNIKCKWRNPNLKIQIEYNGLFRPVSCFH